MQLQITSTTTFICNICANVCMFTSMGGKTTKYTLQHNMINKKTVEKKKQNKKRKKNQSKKRIFFQNVPLKQEMRDDETHEEVEAVNN